MNLLGDLSFFHDMNGLHFLINNKINTKFLILNNNGGQIFSKLEYFILKLRYEFLGH